MEEFGEHEYGSGNLQTSEGLSVERQYGSFTRSFMLPSFVDPGASVRTL